MKAATGPEPAGGQHDQQETWTAVPMTTQGDRRGIPAGADPDKVPAAEHPVMHGQLRRRSSLDYRSYYYGGSGAAFMPSV
jgi:hypothetical protein